VPAHLPIEQRGELAVERFPNGELRVEVKAEVRGQECSLIGSVSPPEERLVSFLLASHTLRSEGAAEVVAVIPYLAYARQDEREPGMSLAAACVGSLLAAAGVDRVVTIDLHSRRAGELFPIPVASLSPAPLFAAEIGALGLAGATIVAPDEGAIERCRAVAEAAASARPVAHLRKRRVGGQVEHLEIVGEIAPSVVIVDDILDTGGTLISCCAELHRAGVERIVVMITHGLFTGPRWSELWSLGVESLYVTDTVPVLAQRPPRGVRVLSVAPVLEAALPGPSRTRRLPSTASQPRSWPERGAG